MTSPEFGGGQTTLEELKHIVKNAQQGIEHELSTTNNTWLECLGSYIFGLDTMLYSLENIGGTTEIPKKKIIEIKQKILALKQRVNDVKTQYGPNPPDNIKQELLDTLRNVI